MSTNVEVSDQAYLEEFMRGAQDNLVVAFKSAKAAAKRASTRIQLPHMIVALLDEPAVRERLSVEVLSRSRTAMAAQILDLPTDDFRAGTLGFKLRPLVDPSHKLAVAWGAPKVSALTFVATCLSPDVPLDQISERTREALRGAGLNLDALAKIARLDVRRHDFTYKLLGFGTDLTAMASEGVWESSPLIGMERELVTLVKMLGTGSACLVGEPGIGKSAFIEGLAWRIATKDRTLIPESMHSWTIVLIQSADVLQGMGVVGQLEERIQSMIGFFVKHPTVIPFFDEVHRLLDSEDNSSRAIATALKPPMARGLFRCVGCTTDKEYARFIAPDEPMKSRLRRFLLQEPDQPTAVRIILNSKANLVRGRARDLAIDISPEAVSSAVKITATYARSDRLPRKAIDLLLNVVNEKVYEVEMAHAADVPRTLLPADVARVFSETYGIPVDALDPDRPAYYRRLREELERRVKGQSAAIGGIVSRLALHSRGWVNQRRPRGRFLLLGPPGVGKTELAISLAAEVMRDNGSLVSFNMADYKGETARTRWQGSDPGYVGYGQTSTIYSRVMMRPFSVVVLDEFEKAHDSLSNPLISIFDGWAEDSQGRQVDFSQCIFVMTSNALVGDPGDPVAAEILRKYAEFLASQENGQPAQDWNVLDKSLREALALLGGIFTRPLLDRIDRICLFSPLDSNTLSDILVGLIEKLNAQASVPLPSTLDSEEVRSRILADATAGDGGSSARGLERALMRWLESSAPGTGENLI